MAISPIAWCTNNAIKYFFVVMWMMINLTVFWRTYMYYKQAPEFYYLHEMLGGGLCISRATANVANLNLGMLLVPVCRSIMAALRSLPFPVSKRMVTTLVDHSKGFHILCAYTLVIASGVHFFGHVINAVSFSENYNTVFTKVNAAAYPKENPMMIVIRSFPGITGIIMLLLLSLILTSSMTAIRHSSFELFSYTHRLFVIFYILVLVHGMMGILRSQTNIAKHTPGCYRSNVSVAYPEPEVAYPEGKVEGLEKMPCSEGPEFDAVSTTSWMWVSIPVFIYTCDVLYRQITRCKTRCHIVGIAHHPGDIIELNIYKEGFTAKAGQFILLQCQSISVMESHPYTVTKCPTLEDPTLTVHIKVSGDWSGRLKNTLLEDPEDNKDTDSLLPATAYNCRIAVEGPFGSPMRDCLRYRVSLWVAGGIGITPFVSHMHALRRLSVRERAERIYFVWLCRGHASFFAFAQLLCDTYQQFWEDNRPDGFQISLHITGERDPVGEVQLEQQHSLLARRLVYGRPCWQALLYNIAQSHQRNTIGVFTCGPKSLVRDISSQCNELRKKGTTFHCYRESF